MSNFKFLIKNILPNYEKYFKGYNVTKLDEFGAIIVDISKKL